METTEDQERALSLTKRALVALKEAEAKLATLEQQRSEPIAVIGMGCRFPGGASSPDAFWQLLSAGADAISAAPAGRWGAGAAEPAQLQLGGFIADWDMFDPGFFRISPREASSLDPQQRMLLEVAWEALEQAGIAGEALVGSPTGVFVGTTNFDHGISLAKQVASDEIDAYFGTGSALSMGAGRLSYVLGLTGPSMVIDTACSSSLVAVHLACQSLRSGECTLALAGGVNFLNAPEVSINLAKAGMLAPDGRCKAFDASADGFVRGEGCGMLVLKRRSDAIADGDSILALIRGSAVNQDGPSGGLTVPNGPAQERLVRQALASGGVEAAAIQYVEAHGTGTALGDPIELGALANVLGQARPSDQPLIVGSVKTNIGHLESAAGIAGLIKVILALRHGEIPASLHMRTPNPHIPWDALPIVIPSAARPWPASQQPRRAGVSSFGFSGTNAHVVLEQAPEPAPRPAAQRPAHLVTLSADSEQALLELARRYRQRLEQAPDTPIAELAFTSTTGRSHFTQRMAASTCSTAQLSQQLASLENGQPAAGVVLGQVRRSADPPPVAWLFTGQGAQYTGMGRQLYESEPLFRRTLEQCDEIVRPYLPQPLLATIYPPDGAKSALDETLYTQPALFALEYALAQLWRSWGFEPAALLGHSIGEYVAACLADVFSLEDALRLVTERGRLMQSLPANGAMAALMCDEQRATQALRPYAGRAAIAAINSPGSVVISGEREVVHTIQQELALAGIESRDLNVSHAFHSPLIEPILAEFARAAAAISYRPPQRLLISNLSGAQAGAEVASPEYWVAHARQPVRFADGLQTLRWLELAIFLELGPKPTLAALGRQALPEGCVWLPSLQSRTPDWQQLLQSLGELYVRGAAVDWQAVGQHYASGRISLPTYPFQRKRYWLDALSKPRNKGEAMPDQETWSLIDEARSDSAPPQSRQRQLRESIRAIIGSLLQLPPAELSDQASLLDLGADSILFLEAIRKIEGSYGVKLAIRQLFEELSTVEALASYVDQHLAPELAAQLFQPAPQAAPAQPLAVAASGQPVEILPAAEAEQKTGSERPESTIERVMRDQLAAMSKLMSEQLSLLRGSGANAWAAGAAPAASSVDTPAAARANGHAAAHSPPSSNGHPPAPAAQPATTAQQPAALGTASGIQTRTRQLTPEQQRYLDAFTERYTRRTHKSKQFTQSYRPVWADIRSTMGFRQETKELCYTLVAERSSGSRMWDIDGNSYIDVAMGFGVHLFGHNPPFIAEALRAQLEKGIHIGPQPDLVGEVSQLISELTGMPRVTFCNSGTEAVMTAIRLARAASGRTRIAIFSDAYHGHSDHTLAIAKMVNGVRQSIPWVPGVPQSVVGEVLVLPYGDPASLEVIRQHLHELAAVLVEPVQSRRPNLQPFEFLRELRRMTAEAEVTLIFDEVITGFRIHPGGVQRWLGIKADLATYGKIVGGGMPIGVVAGEARYLDRIDGGMWSYGDDSFPPVAPSFAAGTFCKHPLAMAAAHAILTRLKREGPQLQDAISARTERMALAIEQIFERDGLSLRVARFGSIFRFTQGNNFSYLYQPLEMDLLFYHLLERGIYLWEGRTCFLSSEHSDADVEAIVDAVAQSVAALRSAGLSSDIGSSGGGAAEPASPSTATSGASNGQPVVTHSFALTRAQRQLWALAQLGDDGLLSSKVTGVLQLRGSLDAEALRQALRMVVERHETLRSTISNAGDVQQIWSALEVDTPLVDLSTLDEQQRQARLAEWFAQESRHSFNFAAGPLFRTTLLRLEPQLHLLVWATHHIVVDGWSITVILREVGKLYSEICQGRAARLAAPLQFREYVEWQSQRMLSEEMAASEQYWLGQFAGPAPTLRMPTDHPRPQVKTYAGSRYTQRLDAGLGRALKQASLEQGATIFMTLMAAYNTLLHQLSGQAEIIVGVPTAGRPLDRGDEIVGYCTNVLPIRSRLAEGASFQSYLAQFRSALFEAYEHQDYPFSELLAKLNLRRDPGASPLVSAIFNLEPRVPLQKAFDLEIDLITPPISFTAYEVDLNITEVGDSFILDFDYNSDLFEQATIARLLGLFEGLLRAFLRDPSQPIATAFRTLSDELDKQTQQAAREQFKKLRQERFRKSVPDTPSPRERRGV